MTFYTTDQTAVVLATLSLGVIIGFLCDILYTLRAEIFPIPLSLFVLDVLFCAISFVLFYLVVYVFNYGYIRWYEIASLALGVYLYRKTFGKIVPKVLIFIIKSVINLIKRVVFLICLPLKFAASCIKKGRIKRYSRRKIRRDVRLAYKGFLN